jgi:glycosyltransferase involved in cell wall biosynthesis
MRNASVFLSKSRFEVGSCPVLEGLASGMPALATNTGFALDFIDFDNDRIFELEENLISSQSKLNKCFEL